MSLITILANNPVVRLQLWSRIGCVGGGGMGPSWFKLLLASMLMSVAGLFFARFYCVVFRLHPEDALAFLS